MSNNNNTTTKQNNNTTKSKESSKDTLKEYTFAQVKVHNKEDDLWLIIDGKVYDVSQYMDEHPGGDILLDGAGLEDATDLFEDVGHSDEAREEMKEFLIGTLKKE
mmetsp:Transcript_18977/g.28265  ORF Transcript_18977/g.28265 Transcript_18977/m.28265 type:complete len:105 (+) Transcript_18977:34-348(+)